MDDQLDRGRVTQLLNQVRQGDRSNEQELLTLIYDQLRRMAQQRMSRERAGHTLQATALVHEAYVRIFGRDNVDWKDRNHFLAIAGREFRRALVDHARQKSAEKRGGDVPKVSLDDLVNNEPGVQGVNADFLDLHDRLADLHSLDPEAAKVIELKFFAGLTDEEVAAEMGISFAKVRRHWTFARSWLVSKLQTRGAAAGS